MKRTVDDDTREIIQSFIAEGYERLDDAEAKLQGLGGEGDREILNAVFRLFHSVKGSAGYLGLNHVKELTHEAETLLDVFLKEKIPTTTESLDVVYETIDILRGLIATVEKELSDESGKAVAAAQAKKIAETVASLRKPAEPEKNEIVENALVEGKMIQRFLGECADLIDGAEKKALELPTKKNCREEINDIFRAVHTIKGNAGFWCIVPCTTVTPRAPRPRRRNGSGRASKTNFRSRPRIPTRRSSSRRKFPK